MITLVPRYTSKQKKRMYRLALINAIIQPLLALVLACQAFYQFRGAGLGPPFGVIFAALAAGFAGLAIANVRAVAKWRHQGVNADDPDLGATAPPVEDALTRRE